MVIVTSEIIKRSEVRPRFRGNKSRPELVALLEKVNMLSADKVLRVEHDNCEKREDGQGYRCKLAKQLGTKGLRRAFPNIGRWHEKAGVMILAKYS